MRKRSLTTSACALALALALAACGAQGGASSTPLPPAGSGAGSDASSGPSSSLAAPAPAGEPDAAPSASGPEKAPDKSAPTPQEQGSAMAKAYQKALEGIRNDHLYPNGDPVDVPEWAEMENNHFAICDVDGDGSDELIYQNESSTMAGMAASIYSFDEDTETLYLELSGFVAMTFYDNGVIRVEASHNHGLSARDDFWPHALYQYDAGGDGYLLAGYADGWDKETFPEDWDGVPFPEDVDRDGDGMIYLITYAGQEVSAAQMDGPDYQKWLDGYVAGASELEIPWQAMTRENIQAVSP